MSSMTPSKKILRSTALLTLAVCGWAVISPAFAVEAPAPAKAPKKRPALIITNNPMSPQAPDSLYARPQKTKDITADQITGASYFEPSETLVSRKIADLGRDLATLQGRIEKLSDKLMGLESENQSMAAEYNASVATISTQLQAGTTPGNPRLIQRLETAQKNLENLAQNVASLNGLAVEIANTASMATFLLESSRSAYGLSGAVEEDHMQLSQIEDQVNNVIVFIDRLLSDVNDDITRNATYLGAERNNIRTLSLAVTNGDLYGKSLSSRPFFSAGMSSLAQEASYTGGAAAASTMEAAKPASARPLVKIRFEDDNVDFEQPVYLAVNEAMERFPAARFEIVAVHPTNANAARVAIESTRARRNAERVLRTLTQMGLPLEKIDLSYMPSAEAQSNEVHIFIH